MVIFTGVLDLHIKQVGVSACPNKRQGSGLCVGPVDQEPVGFNMALPVTAPSPDKRMVPQAFWQGVLRDQKPDDALDLLDVLAASLRSS